MGFTRNISRDRGVLGSILQRLGLPLSLASPLIAHAEAVAQSSERLGLVSPGDRASIVSRHTADSLLFAVARPPKPAERWVDVGSGAGFPGLVLACCFPATRFALVEPNTRKAGFLEVQANSLGLDNTVILARRLEEVEGSFDVAVARALSAPSSTLLSLQSLVKPGGDLVVAAGPGEEHPPGVRRVQLEGIGDVDSPGVLFMMSPGA
ncbi:MAG: 16S rRNA (guanine(527)-N(7))-methyltransferase RsmG [Actinomycetota bacterium]